MYTFSPESHLSPANIFFVKIPNPGCKDQTRTHLLFVCFGGERRLLLGWGARGLMERDEGKFFYCSSSLPGSPWVPARLNLPSIFSHPQAGTSLYIKRLQTKKKEEPSRAVKNFDCDKEPTVFLFSGFSIFQLLRRIAEWKVNRYPVFSSVEKSYSNVWMVMTVIVFRNLTRLRRAYSCVQDLGR